MKNICAVFFNQAALKFVDDLLEKKARLGPEATLYLEILRLAISLRAPPSAVADGAGNRASVLVGIKAQLEAKKVEVDALSGLMDT